MASDPKQVIVLQSGGGAWSVFWGLTLFFIGLPVVGFLGFVFLCSGAAFLAHEGREAAEAERIKLERQQGDSFATRHEPAAHVRVEAGGLEGRRLPAPTSPDRNAPRTWTSANGQFTVEGQFRGLLSGKVRIKKPDGQTISVGLDKLSPEDRAFVQEILGDES